MVVRVAKFSKWYFIHGESIQGAAHYFIFKIYRRSFLEAWEQFKTIKPFSIIHLTIMSISLPVLVTRLKKLSVILYQIS